MPVLNSESEFLTEIEFRKTEAANLVAVLHAANWKIWGEDGAAEMLGIKPSTLSYRMKVFGIKRDQPEFI
jgi:transcriptional regulator with GAF, ATPase, and Fis domain